VSFSAAQTVPAVRLSLEVTTAAGSTFDVRSYVQDRLRSVGIEVGDRCERCDATLSVQYRQSFGKSLLNGAVATEIESLFRLATPQLGNLWAERVVARSPDLAVQASTSESLRQYSIETFKSDLFAHYLGGWVLVKLGRLEEAVLLERAVTNTSPYTAISYRPAKQAVPILRAMGLKGGKALLAALVHPNWDVRADAAAALGEIRMTTAMNVLEQLSRDDKEELVRRAARDAIARLRKETR
jgi:hypothetical protein